MGDAPVVEWSIPRDGNHDSRALPAVADLDGDGVPEVVVNWADGNLGSLAVYAGDGSGERWERDDAQLAYASGAVVADLGGDGTPEILTVRDDYVENGGAQGFYSIVSWSPNGDLLWESDSFDSSAFDYATAISVSDMDHDGSAEIVAGRVILNGDGSTRGVGGYGKGTQVHGYSSDEGSLSAVADLDLDGTEEVVVGNAVYGPDGETLWHSDTLSDGGVAIVNLDDDPEGEWLVVQNDALRAQDTDGTVLWGPLTLDSGEHMGVLAVGDLDGDGLPEIVAPCGTELWALNGEDGSTLWTAPIHDVTGAAGASLFDFDGDGYPEVVYADEIAIHVFDGRDGSAVFSSDDHLTDTFYDYPVIADVDGDGQAEFIIMHAGFDDGLTVYGAPPSGSWAPARALWNQHAYSITNINDDLSVPEEATQNFTVYNNWHSAQAAAPGGELGGDLQAEVLQVCDDGCDQGVLWVTGRGLNAGSDSIPAGLSAALYASRGGVRTLLGTASTSSETPGAMSTEALTFRVDSGNVTGADALVLRIDDDGHGVGQHLECDEGNNEAVQEGSWCAGP